MTTKERWEQAEAAARVLGVSKAEVFNAGVEMDHLIPQILAGNEEAITKAKSLHWFGKKHHETRRESFKRKHKPKKKKASKTNDLRLVLWTIEKIGSLEKAEKAFAAAKLALSD